MIAAVVTAALDACRPLVPAAKRDNAPACLPACLQMVVLWFGVEVAPSFDKPWLSTSFADYWSRRWNLTTTYMLRCEKNGQMLQMTATGAV
jgi:hypothetical protein